MLEQILGQIGYISGIIYSGSSFAWDIKKTNDFVYRQKDFFYKNLDEALLGLVNLNKYLQENY